MVHADGFQIDLDLLDLIMKAECRGEEVPEGDDPDDPTFGHPMDDTSSPRPEHNASAGGEGGPRARKKVRVPKPGETKEASRGKARFTQWRYEKRMAGRENDEERHIKKIALRVLEKIKTIQVDSDLSQHAGRGGGARGERASNESEVFSVASTGFMGRMLRPTPEDLKAYSLEELRELQMRLIEWDGM